MLALRTRQFNRDSYFRRNTVFPTLTRLPPGSDGGSHGFDPHALPLLAGAAAYSVPRTQPPRGPRSALGGRAAGRTTSNGWFAGSLPYPTAAAGTRPPHTPCPVSPPLSVVRGTPTTDGPGATLPGGAEALRMVKAHRKPPISERCSVVC